MATIIPATLQPGVADSFEQRNATAHIRQLRDGTSEQKLDAAKKRTPLRSTRRAGDAHRDSCCGDDDKSRVMTEGKERT